MRFVAPGEDFAILNSMKEITRRKFVIGIDARFYRKATGGIGRYTRELIAHLAVLDTYNDYVVFLTPDDAVEWNLDAENFRTVVVPATHFSKAEQTLFLRVLQKEKCDLVHFLNFNHPVLYRGAFITTLHDLTLYFFPAGRAKSSLARKAAFNVVLRHSLRAAKRVIAVSEYTAQDAERHLKVPQAKMEVIYHGGPPVAEFPFGNKAMVQEYLGTRVPYFLFVSQWNPHKGISTLLEAFNRFKEKTGLPHALVLTGNPKQSTVAQVREAIASSPYTQDIILPGFAPEELLSSVYHNATAYIQPSEYEGFGLTILEAFAAGTPVISTDNSSLPEVYCEAALPFPAKNAQALAARMEELVTSPHLAAELVQKGYAQLKRFSWRKAAEQTHQVYMKTLEKTR